MAARVQVAGIGGVFFKARDPVALAAWYREHLGVPVAPDGAHALFAAADPDEGNPTDTAAPTVWSAFPADTAYFGAGPASWMINYRVPDLDAMLAQLRAAGVWVADEVQDSEYGRFGWAADPEGTRFELWQPPAGAPPAGRDAAVA
jgi:catechol 2,3-dioxygenase-like lactoylglutathione lyase family enzyme